MNIENIKLLVSVLTQTGFGELGCRLLQHICCKPVRFVLTETIINNSDRVVCQLHFERNDQEYRFSHYDATLIKDQSMPGLTINQIVIRDLEARMKAIDWSNNLPGTVFRISDESSWERERNIEAIISELAKLSATEEGRLYADTLKVRFWSGTLVEELTGNLAAVRSKLEVSQRFYFLDGECITLAEAVRFLQNRWIEKREQAKRKASIGSGSEPEGDNNKSSASGSDKKKRKVRVRLK